MARKEGVSRVTPEPTQQFASSRFSHGLFISMLIVYMYCIEMQHHLVYRIFAETL